MRKAKRIARRYVMRKRVVARLLAGSPPNKKPTFDEYVKAKEPFKNPAYDPGLPGSKRDIKFDSLPEEDQAAVKKEYEEKYGPIEEEGEGLWNKIKNAPDKLIELFDKMDDITSEEGRRKVVRGIGGFLGKGLKKLTQNSIVGVVDKVMKKIEPVTGQYAFGGLGEKEYAEQKNYRMMGQVVGNWIAPGSFDLEPEEKKVGQQYLVNTVLSAAPIGWSRLKKFAVGFVVGGTVGMIPIAGPLLAPVAAFGAMAVVNSWAYRELDNKFSDYWQKKGKGFDDVTAAYINGYINMEKLDKQYKKLREQIEDDPELSTAQKEDELKELAKQYEKDVESIKRGQEIVSKYAQKTLGFDDAFRKVMSDVMRTAFEELLDGIENDEDTQAEFAQELKDKIHNLIEDGGIEKAGKEAQKWLKEQEKKDKESGSA